MSSDRPVLSLKRKPARDPQSNDAPVMINGKRMEFPRHRKKVRDNPSSAIDRFNQDVNTPPGKRMKRPGQPSPAKPAPAPAPHPFPWWSKRKANPAGPPA